MPDIAPQYCCPVMFAVFAEFVPVLIASKVTPLVLYSRLRSDTPDASKPEDVLENTCPPILASIKKLREISPKLRVFDQPPNQSG